MLFAQSFLKVVHDFGWTLKSHSRRLFWIKCLSLNASLSKIKLKVVKSNSIFSVTFQLQGNLLVSMSSKWTLWFSRRPRGCDQRVFELRWPTNRPRSKQTTFHATNLIVQYTRNDCFFDLHIQNWTATKIFEWINIVHARQLSGNVKVNSCLFKLLLYIDNTITYK